MTIADLTILTITISMIIFNNRFKKYKIIDYCPSLSSSMLSVSYKELFIFKQFNTFAINVESIFHSCLPTPLFSDLNKSR